MTTMTAAEFGRAALPKGERLVASLERPTDEYQQVVGWRGAVLRAMAALVAAHDTEMPASASPALADWLRANPRHAEALRDVAGFYRHRNDGPASEAESIRYWLGE